MGDKMMARRNRQMRQVMYLLGILLVIYFFLFTISGEAAEPSIWKLQAYSPPRRPANHVLNNLSLDEKQCAAAFPGLTKEIDDVVAEGPFKVRDTGDLGPIQARVKDGQVRALSG
jgi:hypothetical protein